MIKRFSSDKSLQIFLLLALAAITGYVLLNVVTPSDPKTLDRYHISSVQLTLVRLSLIIPFLIYWAAGVWSASILKSYANRLGKAAVEGRAIDNIGKGIMVLVFGLIFTALVGSLRSYLLIGSEPYINFLSNSFLREDVMKFFTILTNYLNVLFQLIGFWFIWQGSKFLVGTLGGRKVGTNTFGIATIFLLALSAAYALLVFANPYRQVGNPPLINPTYYISDFMIFTTIIVPYVIYWFLGIFALLNIAFYTKAVPGIVYKKFFSNITIGFLLLIILSISLQFLSTIGYTFAAASFSFILLLVYAIVLVQALGYVFIARGAGKLKSIEDVTK